MSRSVWHTIKSEIVYENNYFVVRKDKVLRPDSTEGYYYFTDIPPSVMVVAITSNQHIYLVGQERYTTKTYSWELPGGSSVNEEPLEAAKRELLEETGIIAENWQKLGTLQIFNGLSNHISYVYLADAISQTGGHKQEEDGITAMLCISFLDILSMINDGNMTDSGSISAIILAATHLNIFGKVVNSIH